MNISKNNKYYESLCFLQVIDIIFRVHKKFDTSMLAVKRDFTEVSLFMPHMGETYKRVFVNSHIGRVVEYHCDGTGKVHLCRNLHFLNNSKIEINIENILSDLKSESFYNISMIVLGQETKELIEYSERVATYIKKAIYEDD